MQISAGLVTFAERGVKKGVLLYNIRESRGGAKMLHNLAQGGRVVQKTSFCVS